VATLSLKNRGRDAIPFFAQKDDRPPYRQDPGQFAGDDKPLDLGIQRNQVNITGGQGFPEPFPGYGNITILLR